MTRKDYSKEWRKRSNGAYLIQSKIRRQEKKQAVDLIKLERGCTDCGYNQHPEALDLDYLPEFEKFMEVSVMIAQNYTLERILEEVAKCEVVCSNCHRIRTFERRQ